mgnify:CR=1 FL=1
MNKTEWKDHKRKHKTTHEGRIHKSKMGKKHTHDFLKATVKKTDKATALSEMCEDGHGHTYIRFHS